LGGGGRAPAGQREMKRLYAVECSPSVTGAAADHRLPLRASAVEPFARAVAAALGVSGVRGPESGVGSVPPQWMNAVIKDLQQHRGPSLAIPAAQHPPL